MNRPDATPMGIRSTNAIVGMSAVVGTLVLGIAGCLPFTAGTLGDACQDDSDCFKGQRCAERGGERICVRSDAAVSDTGGDDTDTRGSGDIDTRSDTGPGRDADAGMDTGGEMDADGGDTSDGPEGYSVEGTLSAGGYCSGGSYSVQGHVSFAPAKVEASDSSGYSVRMTRERHEEPTN